MQRGILRTGEDAYVLFWCPGCDGAHGLRVCTDPSPGPRWGFNGHYERPTITPSLLVRYDGANAGSDGAPPAVCHSFVTDGRSSSSAIARTPSQAKSCPSRRSTTDPPRMLVSKRSGQRRTCTDDLCAIATLYFELSAEH